jgi:hypothetical protein
MKNYEHKVIFLNGNEECFYCGGFVEAIVLAMAYAQQKGWDMRIKYVTDEKGTTIKDVEYPSYKFAK